MEKITPQEAAINLIETYAKRGDDMNEFKKGHLGCCGPNYSASIGGYMWSMAYLRGEEDLGVTPGKKIPNTKILVEKINGEPCNEVFDLAKIWDMAINGVIQPTLL